MKLLVVADSHGYIRMLSDVIDRESPFHYLIHCGDGINDLMHVNIPGDARIVRVMGNVDMARGMDAERLQLVRVHDKNIMVTHGDLFRVQYDYDRIIEKGKNLKADIILFGHTHIKMIRRENPLLFNPGTLTKGLYGVIEVSRSSADFYHRNL